MSQRQQVPVSAFTVGQKVEATMQVYAMPLEDLRENVVGPKIGSTVITGIISALPSETVGELPVNTVHLDQGEGAPTFIVPLDIIRLPHSDFGRNRLARFALQPIDERIN